MHSIWQICQFELIRLFLTKRGGILLLAFAIIWYLIFKYPILHSANILSNPSFGENITAFSQQLNLQHLIGWQYGELAMYWLFAVFAFPISAVLMSSDQLASDATRGTLRFILLRSSRNQVLFGRFLGQILILASLVTLTLTAAFMMGLYRDSSLALQAFDELLFVGFNLILISLPFIALTSLFNIILKSSKLSVVMVIIAIPIFHAVISYLSLFYSIFEPLLFVLPGIQLTDAVQMPNLELSKTTVLPLVQTVGYLAIAQLSFARRAL